jgi:hypothetical protein
MKVRSSKNSDGFDYMGVIQVLNEPVLRLALSTYGVTTLAANAGMAFDFLHNGVHAWCGHGVGKPEIRNWIDTLRQITRETGDEGWAFYGGHGREGGHELVRNMEHYLETFTAVTRRKPAGGHHENEGALSRRRAG